MCNPFLQICITRRPPRELIPSRSLIFRIDVLIIVIAAENFQFRLGLSTREVEATGESLGARATAESASPETLMTAKRRATVHHAEKDLRVDATAHSTSHAAAKHVRRIYQILAAVVPGALSVVYSLAQVISEIFYINTY